MTGNSASLAQRERAAAIELANTLGVEHCIIDTEEVASPDYAANPTNRCYYCKSELYSKLKEVADQCGVKTIVNGTNVDDLGDHRPRPQVGTRSERAQSAVRSGIHQTGRARSRPATGTPRVGQTGHALPVLAHSLRTGRHSRKKLKMIEQAEDFLIALGFTQLRVRHYGESARIETTLRRPAALFIKKICSSRRANGFWKSVSNK